MTIDAFSLDELRGLSGVKWSRDDGDVLAAWVADMDVRPPACVTDTLADLVARSDFGYNRRAHQLLGSRFAEWQLEHHGWNVNPDEVRTFCDVLHAIDVALWLMTEPGDGVVLLTPVYPPFLNAVEASGRRVVDVPLDPEGWGLDAERLAAAIDDRTRAVLLCNPHNPTGRVFTTDELAAIGRVAAEHDLLILSDEVWADLTHPGHRHVPTATVDDEMAARTLTISSASKAFNLAGLRCAVAHAGHAGLARALDDLPGHLLGAVGTPGAEATVAAWSHGRSWLAELRTHLTARRDQLATRLAADAPAIGFQLPEATYLGWLDLRSAGLGHDPAASLLDRVGLALSPGPDFGPHGRGFVRLNFATSAEILDLLVDRLVTGVEGVVG